MLSIRDLQESDPQWTRAKGFDTFCPLGPNLVSDIDPGNLRVRMRVNGDLMEVEVVGIGILANRVT